MADPTDTNGAVGGDRTLLEALGARRDARAAVTQKAFALPGNDGRLWALCKLLGPERHTMVATSMATGQKGLLGVALDYIADSTVEIFLADGAGEDGEPANRRSLPGIMPGSAPLTYRDDRLETLFPALCPPRPAGAEHSPSTRVRALFGADALAVSHAMQIVGWAVGGEEAPGALSELSSGFVGE
jgi:hypothetical protein